METPPITKQQIEEYIKALQLQYTADQERVRDCEVALRKAKSVCERRKKELTAFGTILASLREIVNE